MRSHRGFTLMELMIAAIVAAGLIAAAATFLKDFSTGSKKISLAESSLENLALPLSVLKRDVQAAQGVVAVAGANPQIKVTLRQFSSSPTPTVTTQDIFYTIQTAPCPEYGASAQCKTLVRKVGSAVGAPQTSFGGMAGLEWCLYDSTGATAFDTCSAIPSVISPAIPVNRKRFAVAFQRRSATDLTKVVSLVSVVDLENVPINAATRSLNWMTKQ